MIISLSAVCRFSWKGEVMETRSRKLQRGSEGKSVFVTVGTLKFEKLIETVCSASTLKCLQMLGYEKVLLQIGSGGEPVMRDVEGISVEYYRFKPSIKPDIESANLVISHAGAGSCLETLRSGKKLLVVINDELMGNHQLELAYQLHKDGHLHYCTCQTLVETLESVDFTKLVPFQSGRPELFAKFLDQMMGFT